MRIYLIGFMGAGKTTVGKLLAERNDCRFIDLDAYLEEQAGESIAQIFMERGEKAFRKAESYCLRELALEPNVVIATGGGTPCFSDNLALMLGTGTTVYLQLEAELLAHRLLNGQTQRPLIKDFSKVELLHYIDHKLAERQEYYSQAHQVFKVRASDMAGDVATTISIMLGF